MDHSAAAMATLPTPGPPRSTPKSVRNASAKEDEKDALIAAMEQRLEQLEGKLTLMFRDRVATVGVRGRCIYRTSKHD